MISYTATMQVQMVEADAIEQYPGNPRNGDIDAIMDSIMVNGVYRPIYVQTSTRYILAGNHTYQALLGLGEEKVPVLWIDCDDEAAHRIMLADNKIAEMGGYDPGLLLQALEALDGNLLGTGWTADELETMNTLQRLDAEAAATRPDGEWPMIKFRVSPQAREAFWALCPDGDDNARFMSLLRRAGWDG